MIHIHPISDLRNKFTEIETLVKDGNVVHLTKNGYGTMVVMSTEKYSELLEDAKSCKKQENSAVQPSSPAPSVRRFRFSRKKNAVPENPELAREEEERRLGSHTMLDHDFLPTPGPTGIGHFF